MTPPDEPARQRIAADLGSTLFVEAGAGSGKTTALVGRIVALVTSGEVELGEIAAITFTEKAGAELRDRVRQALQRTADDPTADAATAERCRRALDQLDGAAIGTLHAFAQRILTEHPVEAELPPRIEVIDEVSSGIAFDRRWSRTLDALLADPTLERTLLLLTAAGLRPEGLRALARAFDSSWDLVEDSVPAHAAEPPDVGEAVVPVLAALRELEPWVDHCLDPQDRLMKAMDALFAWGERLQATDDDVARVELLRDRPTVASNAGRKGSWRDGCKDEVLAAAREVVAQVDQVRTAVFEACAHRLGAALRAHTLAAAAERRAAGRLEFHDLLVLARQVLRHPEHGAAVRTALQQRYRRLLLDEFQDTDPIQLELAVRIAAMDPATATAARWQDVEVDPGRLFLVGDPKQSIYRFRRADISTFLEAREHFGERGGGLIELTANFRTVEPVISWVNHVFGVLLAEAPDTDTEEPSQPAYVALEAQREPGPGGPQVAVMGRTPHPYGTPADALREAEARDVAATISTALRERWPVRDGDGWRDCRLGDVTILVPARTSLPFLEDALGAAGIPFRTESSSLVYATRAIRDLLMVLRAADDPTDHHRIVAALRTPLLACGDDDLFRHKVEQRRSWSYNTPTPPDPADGPVSAGLAFLRELHEARHWSSPAELLDRIARDRRALELGFAEGRPRDVWRRIRFVIDQARAWSEAAGGSLRAYLHWVDQQTVEGARVSEAVLPETDDDAVRIMTIHAAKGLEFPITIVSGMSTKAGGQQASVAVRFPRGDGRVGYRLGREVITEAFEASTPIDEQMGYDERVRLLYVAATRAKDHLVVSLHRAERRSPPKEKRNRTNAEVLVAGMGEELVEQLPEVGGEPVPLPSGATHPAEPPPPYEAWEAARREALTRAARPRAVAATALTDEGEPDLDEALRPPAPAADAGPADEARPVQASLFDAPAVEPPVVRPDGAAVGGDAEAEPDPGLQKRPRDLDLPPWLKGRYGTAVGRAVHGVLQTIDLATGDGLDAAVAAQCQAEAVVDRTSEVRQLVEQALGAPCVRAAAAAPHWREVYACTPIGDRLLEGYVDLLYRGEDGLVVVDHKTSASAAPDELDRRVEGYRLQGAAYAVAVGRATGEPVTRVVFLFLTPHGAIERELSDLPAAMADVERLVAAGEELVVG